MLDGLDKIDLTAADAMEQINALATGLVGKNAQLLEKLTAGKDAGNQSAAELENLRLFKQNAEQNILEEGKQYAEAKQGLIDTHTADMLKLNERITGFEKGERTRLITDGISSELTELKVNPLHSKTTAAYFESMSQVVDGKAMIGDKTQSEFIKEWALSDSGKASCLAQGNSGGDGGQGSKFGSSSNKKYSDMSLKERAAHNNQ